MSTSSIPQKRCNSCKQYYPATHEYFSRYKYSKDGFKQNCKACGKAATQKWREEHYDQYREYNRLYTEEHHEYYNEISRQSNARCRAKDPEKHRAKQREYYHKDVDHSRKLLRDWRKKNGDRVRCYKRISYAKHADSIRGYSREWAKANPLKRRVSESGRRARKRSAQGSYTDVDIQSMLKDQKGLCKYCSKDISNQYHIDHVVPLSRGGSNELSNLVLSCSHCNLSKGKKMLNEWMETRGW